MRKKLSCWLAIVLVLCMLPIQTFAAAVQPRREFYVVMVLCATGANWSFDENSSAFGHAFLTFYNESDFTIEVGHMSVPEGDAVTVGTFLKDTHEGIWYNIEACEQPSGVYAISYTLTASELEEINTMINGTICIIF